MSEPTTTLSMENMLNISAIWHRWLLLLPDRTKAGFTLLLQGWCRGSGAPTLPPPPPEALPHQDRGETTRISHGAKSKLVSVGFVMFGWSTILFICTSLYRFYKSMTQQLPVNGPHTPLIYSVTSMVTSLVCKGISSVNKLPIIALCYCQLK